jgi:formylglycine-generating enzyme required for sulfatase activity
LFPAGDTPSENGNEEGVAELAGNVWEWCSSQWTGNFTNKPDRGIGAPSDGAVVVVARGGSWSFGHDVKYISPLRRGFLPSARFNDVGIRLVRTG